MRRPARAQRRWHKPVDDGQQVRGQLGGNSRSQGLEAEQALDRKWGITEVAFT